MLEFAYRVAAVDERIAQVRRVLDRLEREKDTLPKGASVLLERVHSGIGALLDEHTTRVKALEEGLTGKRRDARVTKHCNDIAYYLEAVAGSVLPVLEGARSHRVPVEFEPVLKSGVEKSSGGAWRVVAVVLYTDFKRNYAVHVVDDTSRSLDWAKRLEQGHGSPTAQYERDRSNDNPPPNKIIILSAPNIHRDSVLLQTIMLGHELGHIRDWRHNTAQGIAGSLSRVIDSAAGDVTVGDYEAEKTPQAGTDWESQVESWGIAPKWLREFAADAYAVHTLGPAAAFALLELDIPDPIAADSRSHPGTDRRLANMLAILDQSMGYGPEHLAASPTASPLQQEIESLKRLADGALEREVWASPSDVEWRRAVERAWAFVKKQLPVLRAKVAGAMNADGSTFSYSRWESEVPDVMNRLKRGLPVGERIDTSNSVVAASNRAILNGAWMVKLHGLSQLSTVLGFCEQTRDATDRAREVLDDLVLKSFEVSRYRERASKNGLCPTR